MAVRFEPGPPSSSPDARGSREGVEIQPPADLANVFDASGRTLPLLPLGLGFAADTLFYAAGAWLLCRIPLGVRRFNRARRGLCPACGYPRGEAAICSECGASLGSAGRTVVGHQR
jgi:hypothetical protein